jgi:methylmalonyl-CoA mutase cobalamin-binding domain/chain
LTESVVFVIGGVFPPDDTFRLKEIGYDDIFIPDPTKGEIISSIKELVKKKRI